MSTEFNPESNTLKPEAACVNPPTDQQPPQSIDQARLAAEVQQQEGSTLPPNQAGYDNMPAPVKHDIAPPTPEQQSITQPASQTQVYQTEAVAPAYQAQVAQPAEPMQVDSAPTATAPVVAQAPAQPQFMTPVQAQQPVAPGQLTAATSAAPADVQMTQAQPPVSQNGPPQPAFGANAAPATGVVAPAQAFSSLAGQAPPAQPAQQPVSQQPATQQRILPPMRVRKDSEDHIYIDADVYQSAFMNIQLPHGIKLDFEDNVHRSIARQKKRDKDVAHRRLQEERAEKQRQKMEAAQKKKQEADLARQQKLREKQERDLLMKQEQEQAAYNMSLQKQAAAELKRAEMQAKQEALKAGRVVGGQPGVVDQGQLKTLEAGRQSSMASGGEGVEGDVNARMSGRAKSKKDYVGIHRGTSFTNEFNKGFPVNKAPVPGAIVGPGGKGGSSQSAKQRGIQVNSAIMKKCTDLLKSVRDVCRHPDLMVAVQQADQLVVFTKSVGTLDLIEANLRDFKYQRAQDMISQIKDAIYDTIKLGQKSTELYPVLMNAINNTNALIENAKLADKSVFSQVSQVQNKIAPGNDVQMQRQLSAKDKQIRKLEEQVKKIAQKKTDKKQPPVKKPAEVGKTNTGAKTSNSGSLNNQKQAQPAPNMDQEKPLTVEERDNLIHQINSLTPQQSEGIITIVQEYAQRDDNNQVTFELTQLPVFLCRNLESYVKKCISENDKKQKRKEKDAQRRVKKREEQKQKQIQQQIQQVTQPVSQQPQQVQVQQQLVQSQTVVAPATMQNVAAPQQQVAPQQILATQGQVTAGQHLGDTRQQQQAQVQQQTNTTQRIPISSQQVLAQQQPQQQTVVQQAQSSNNQMKPQATTIQAQPQWQAQQTNIVPQQTFQGQQPAPQPQYQPQQQAQQQNTIQQPQQLNQQALQQQIVGQQSQPVVANQQVMVQGGYQAQQPMQQFTQQTPGQPGQQPQFAPQQAQQIQPQQPMQQMQYEHMDNETLLQHMLANPQLVRSSISQQRQNDLENYKLQQSQFTQQQQTQQYMQPNQVQQQTTNVQQQPQQMSVVLQNQLAQQQQMQKLQQMQLQQVNVGMPQQQQQPVQTQQAGAQMQPIQQQTNQVMQHQQVLQHQQQQLVMQQQQIGVQQQTNKINAQGMRVDDDSESSSSDSDEDEAGQQRQVNAQNTMLMPGQGMIPQQQQFGADSDITKVWQQNIDKQ